MKKKEKKWKSVRVLTAVELEDWLSQCPSVAVWLTSIIKRNFDLRIDSVEEFWKKWSVNEDGMTLNYQLLLGGRESAMQNYSLVRGPYDGGDIEYNKAARFRKTAEKLQIMYPITSEIFRDLSDVYMNEAKRHDTEVEIMKLDN